MNKKSLVMVCLLLFVGILTGCNQKPEESKTDKKATTEITKPKENTTENERSLEKIANPYTYKGDEIFIKGIEPNKDNSFTVDKSKFYYGISMAEGIPLTAIALNGKIHVIDREKDNRGISSLQIKDLTTNGNKVTTTDETTGEPFDGYIQEVLLQEIQPRLKKGEQLQVVAVNYKDIDLPVLSYVQGE